MASVHYGRLLGTSGFAKTVAIKRLHRALARVESFKKMILEEGRLAARIRHPNVVPPLDVLAEGGELLLVMEYVHGESLSRLLRAAWKLGERVPLPVGAAILSNVLHGLHAAHEARDEAGNPLDIVHRDVSPQNVIVGVDGVARVIDFGIAKAVTSEEMTMDGTIKGKVPYLAPEQLEGDPATKRTDIYAAAVVFWEVLANRRLFDGKDDGEVLRQIISMEVLPPSTFNPLVSGEVDDVVLRAIARDPKERFASAREMALAIESALHLATSTVVGAWTEKLAAETLAQRAQRIREVEATALPPAEPADEGTHPHGTVRMSAADAGVPGASIPLPPPPPKRASVTPPPPMPPQMPAVGERVSSAPMRPPVASRPLVEPRTVIYEPPPMPEPAFIEGVRPIARDAPAPPAAGVLRKPEVAIPNVNWLPPVEPKAPQGSAFKRFLRYLAAFLVLTLIVAWMFAPAIARAWIVTGAASRGIIMTIEDVDVSRRSIRLKDVHVESPDLPGTSARAGTVTIGLRWLVPDVISIDDVEVSLDGSYADIEARLAQYRAKHGAVLVQAAGGIRKVEVSSGRIDWKNVIGAGTSALVENITVDVTKNAVRGIGDDYKLTAPLFRMQIAGAAAGPWQIDIDRQGILVRSIVRFDPSGTYPASVTRTAGDDGSVSLKLEIPPTSLRDLHLPGAVLGGLATGSSRLEAQGEIAIVTMQQTTTRGAEAGASSVGDAGATSDAAAEGGAPAALATTSRAASGRLKFGGYGLAVFAASPPVDVSLDLPLTGDAARPIGIAATFTVGPAEPMGGTSPPAATAAMTGTLDFSGAAARVELAGKTGAIPCVKAGGATAPVAPAAVKQTALVVAIVAKLDDFPGAKVAFQPASACTPRLR